jgi:hypothetical protein
MANFFEFRERCLRVSAQRNSWFGQREIYQPGQLEIIVITSLNFVRNLFVLERFNDDNFYAFALLGGSNTTVTFRFPQLGHMRRDSNREIGKFGPRVQTKVSRSSVRR